MSAPNYTINSSHSSAGTPIILIPLDGRPVCYDLPSQLAAIGNITLNIPPKAILGELKKPADLNALDEWLTEQLEENPDSPVILSMDMLLFGGLIPGRVLNYDCQVLKQRLDFWLKKLNEKTRTLFAFSTILRIPNYNNAEEEPDYWNQFGQALYEASYKAHQTGDYSIAFESIPKEIHDDFKTRRQLHHEINWELIHAYEKKLINTLSISQDDTGAYGLNVQEAEEYQKYCADNKLNITIQTGADELALTALAKIKTTELKKQPKVYIHFDPEHCRSTLAKFDGKPIEAVITAQALASGAIMTTSKDDADLILWVHGPEEKMGDHCENNNRSNLNSIADFIETVNHQPVVFIDIANANGSDDAFISQLITSDINWTNLYGYAGWNTPGNTAGSAIAMGVMTWLAKQTMQFNAYAWQKTLLTRLVDDWAYQSHCRGILKTKSAQPDVTLLETEMAPYCQKIIQALQMPEETQLKLTYPCHRFFEIEVTLS